MSVGPIRVPPRSRIPVKRLLNRMRAFSSSGTARWMCTDSDVAALEEIVEQADRIVREAAKQNEQSDEHSLFVGIAPTAIALYKSRRAKFPE